ITPTPVITTCRVTENSFPMQAQALGRPVIKSGRHRVRGGPPRFRVVCLYELLEVTADLNERRVCPGCLDGLATVLVIEILQMEIKASVVKQLTTAGAHPMRHLAGIEPGEQCGHLSAVLGVHSSYDQRAVHQFRLFSETT